MIKDVWNRLVGKEASPEGWVSRICSIGGEVTPGFISLDIAAYDAKTLAPIEAHTKRIELPIPSNARPTCNRILAGQHTPEDLKVLNLMLSKHPLSKF